MIDTVKFADGSGSNRKNLGGPATFAYTGIKLWTDHVIQCSKLGADYEELFLPWAEKNKIDMTGLKVVCNACNHTHITYVNKDGAMTAVKADEKEKSYLQRGTNWEDFGFMKTSPEDIEAFTCRGGVKGVYLAQNCDRVYWDKIRTIKKRDGFKMMWELEGSVAFPEFLDNIRYAAEIADLFSLNITEAERLFEVKGDAACIAELQKLPVEFTLFRVGSRGLYSVTPAASYHIPPAPCTVVDPTGCGNSSTGSALYAWTEGKDPLMTGVMANVASAMNINQYGVIPDLLGVRPCAREMAEQLYETHREKYFG